MIKPNLKPSTHPSSLPGLNFTPDFYTCFTPAVQGDRVVAPITHCHCFRPRGRAPHSRPAPAWVPPLDQSFRIRLLPLGHPQGHLWVLLPLSPLGRSSARGGSILEPAGIGSVGHGGGFTQLLTAATPGASLLPKPGMQTLFMDG